MKLEPGTKAPNWKLPTADGNTLSLADLRGKKVILCTQPVVSS
jgi:thioredoxin-dependent peroxiredoxin